MLLIGLGFNDCVFDSLYAVALHRPRLVARWVTVCEVLMAVNGQTTMLDARWLSTPLSLELACHVAAAKRCSDLLMSVCYYSAVPDYSGQCASSPQIRSHNVWVKEATDVVVCRWCISNHKLVMYTPCSLLVLIWSALFHSVVIWMTKSFLVMSVIVSISYD